jgi:hypothetical protein
MGLNLDKAASDAKAEGDGAPVEIIRSVIEDYRSDLDCISSLALAEEIVARLKNRSFHLNSLRSLPGGESLPRSVY